MTSALEPENCWEFWNCPDEARDTCLAYTTDSGKECFHVAATTCAKVLVGHDYQHCWQCPWYERINPDKGTSTKRSMSSPGLPFRTDQG